jgi:hypothetical protein
MYASRRSAHRRSNSNDPTRSARGQRIVPGVERLGRNRWRVFLGLPVYNFDEWRRTLPDNQRLATLLPYLRWENDVLRYEMQNCLALIRGYCVDEGYRGRQLARENQIGFESELKRGCITLVHASELLGKCENLAYGQAPAVQRQIIDVADAMRDTLGDFINDYYVNQRSMGHWAPEDTGRMLSGFSRMEPRPPRSTMTYEGQNIMFEAAHVDGAMGMSGVFQELAEGITSSLAGQNNDGDMRPPPIDRPEVQPDNAQPEEPPVVPDIQFEIDNPQVADDMSDVTHLDRPRRVRFS